MAPELLIPAQLKFHSDVSHGVSAVTLAILLILHMAFFLVVPLSGSC
jgi:hypothetical protein